MQRPVDIIEDDFDRVVDPNCAVKFDKWVVGWYGRDLDWIEGEGVGELGGLTVGQLGSTLLGLSVKKGS